MISTCFLGINNYELYGSWLREQSQETLATYFGIAVDATHINHLIDGIVSNPKEHYFLIATQGTTWTGVIHMARISEHEIEFGIMVADQYRNRGIADQLMSEAIVWIRNRGYTELFMHCLGCNKPIQHLCQKHGLMPRNIMGDSEVKIQLNPPSWVTIASEVGINQRNVYHTFLQTSQLLYQKIYG
jgi:GNAT superfamily N-acetyltransferase